MKSIILSVQRKHNGNIESGIKTEELRKVIPNIPTPYKVYTYESKTNGGRGMVTNEWICDKVEEFTTDYRMADKNRLSEILKNACLTLEEATEYDNGKCLYALHISNLKVYDKPKELGEFKFIKTVRRYHRKGETKFERLQHSKRVEVKYITRPPQNYMFCEQIKDKE